MTLTLGESWPAWHPTARRGILELDGVARDVLVLLAPYQPSGVARAREAAGPALGMRGEGILGLLEIRAENQRIAWVYEGGEALAVSRLPDEATLGPRAVAGLVHRVARALVAFPGHPGPEADDVLLLADGEVRVIGFARPFAAPAAQRPPGRPDPEAERVYRLGALTATLLGGPLQRGADPSAHDAVVRRALIRAMSAPGPALGDRYLDLLRGMLAFDPDDRPPLTAVVQGMAELAERAGGPSLSDVVARGFPRWLAAASGEDPDETTLPQEWLGFDVGTPDLTVETVTDRRSLSEPILGDLTAEDEPTVDSELGVVPQVGTPPSVVERGSIPVAVGPPAEVASRRPTLPSDLFEATPAPSTPADVTTPLRASPARPAELPDAPPWLRIAAVLLAGVAVGLAAWLILG